MKYDLGKLGKGRIGVIGDFCLDVYWHADMTKSELSRETPHFPLPIVQERLSPGGAGNVAMNVLALEPKKVYALGVFGDDWRGLALKGLLERAGADVSGVVTDRARVTNTYIKPLRKGYAENVVYEDSRLDFTNYEPLAAATEKKLLALLDKVAKKIDVLCVCDQMPFGCITAAVRDRICELGKAGLRVIVDSRDRIGLYSNAIVKPNEIEASRVFKGKVKPTDFEKLAKLLEARTDRPAIVTAGEKGCFVSENARVTHVPACKVTGEIDFCGAGDTFLSCLACATAAGFPLVDAAALACAASAVTIKKLRTTGTATRAELIALNRDCNRTIHAGSRREFLGGFAAAAAAVGCRSMVGDASFYGPTIRDRLWMWGHHAQMCHKSGFKDGRKWEGPTVEQAEGCRLMGIPNDCFIRWGNMPAHPWGDYIEQFRHVKRFTFGITDGGNGSVWDKLDWAINEIRPAFPNFTGGFLDDFFSVKALTQTEDAVAKIADRLHANGLRLSIVVYSDQDGIKPAFKPYLDMCDETSFWCWHSKNLGKHEDAVRRMRDFIGPEKSLLMGVYMWDYTLGQPVPADRMEMQLDFALRLLREKVVTGLIFHPTYSAALDVPAVSLAKKWIRAHGEDLWGV